MKECFELFLAFARVSSLTFGGGYAMIPLVDRELIKKRGWVTMEEVIDYYTIAQITPGLIGVNLATFVGYKRKGTLGGIFATLGYVVPSATYILVVALFISNFAEIPVVQHAFTGIRIAVGALILDTVIKLVKGVFKDYKALVIYAIVFVLSILPAQAGRLLGIIPVFFKSPVLLVVVSGLIGLLIYRQKKDNSPDDTQGNKQ